MAALVFSVGFLAIAIYPAQWDANDDSFPLSNYPMFSQGRPSPDIVLTHAVALTDSGERVPIEPMVSAGNREVLQSMRTIELGVRSGADAFCQEVAARAREAGLNASIGAESVEIVTQRWDAVAYFAADDGDAAREGTDRRVHARCDL
ncbi:MAG: hypothetical protein AAF411_20925 [Myxococcota bacterium]